MMTIMLTLMIFSFVFMRFNQAEVQLIPVICRKSCSISDANVFHFTGTKIVSLLIKVTK